jgi:ABC-type sugar transport system ATPase subunit
LADAGASALLRLRGVDKAYGAVAALTGVDLTLVAGEIHAVVGENGAGKSTLLGVIGGSVRPDAGEVFVRGERRDLASPRAARRSGIAVIHQRPALLGELSVAENLALGADGFFVRWRRREARARELLARVGADL